MATLVRRVSADGAVTWQARIRIRGEHAQSRTFKRKTDATAWAVKVEADLQAGMAAPQRSRTLADLIDRYLEYLPTRRRKDTIRNVCKQLEWWREHFGCITLDRFRPDVVARGRTELAKRTTRAHAPISGPTINRYQAALSAACKYAVRELRWLPTNPCLSVTKAPESAGVVRFLSDDERHALFEACRADADPNILTAVTLALATGLRYSNIRYLQWADVDLTGRVLIVARTKNGEGRRVPLIASACDALRAQYERDPTGEGWVFKGHTDAVPAALHWPWRRVRAAAGLDGFRFHDLRHTTASYLTQSGAGLAQVADALGHKTLAMARRYSHQSAENVRATLESIADRLGAP